MTTQSVKLTGLPYLDDEMPYDAVRALRLMKQGLETIFKTSYRVRNSTCIEVDERTISGMITELHSIITDAEAVYAEHADLCKLMKHLNRAVKHYEVED